MHEPQTPAELKAALKEAMSGDVVIDSLQITPELISAAIDEFVQLIENVYVGEADLTPCQSIIGRIFLNRIERPTT